MNPITTKSEEFGGILCYVIGDDGIKRRQIQKPPIAPAHNKVEYLCRVLLEDKVYLTNDENIFFCAYFKKWFVKDSNTGLDSKGNLVHFHPAVHAVVYKNGKWVIESNLDLTTYKPCLNGRRIFWTKDGKVPNTDFPPFPYWSSKTQYKIKDHPDTEIVSKLSKAFVPKIYMENLHLYKYVDLSFGVELEVSSSQLPDYICSRLAFIPLKDGSLSHAGVEYTSLPLQGLLGIKRLIAMYSYINQYCKMNFNCSIHVHIELPDTSPKTIVALYYLYYRIQAEILELMPYYVTYPQTVRKYKVFAASLPPLNIKELLITKPQGYIDKAWENIGNLFDPGQDYLSEKAWLHPGRYMALNLSSLLSGGKTAEFRVHPPTMDVNRILNWLVLCTAIVKFASYNQDLILEAPAKMSKLCLEDVVQSLPTELRVFIDPYIQTLRAKRVSEYMEAMTKSKGKGQDKLFEILTKKAKEDLGLTADVYFSPNTYRFSDTLHSYSDEISEGFSDFFLSGDEDEEYDDEYDEEYEDEEDE